MKKYILGLFFIAIFLVSTGAICKGGAEMPKKMVLKFWSPVHNEEALQESIANFEALYPYVNIEYTKLNYDEYDELLINSWAKNQGPDIFSMPNSYVKKYYDLIYPLPSALNITTVEVQENFGKKDTIINKVQQRSISPEELKSQYIDTVYSDSVFPYQETEKDSVQNKVFALPLFSDTLALYYNKDLLNQASISVPATNWQDIVDQTEELTKIDKEGNIIQSGIALGTSNNISNYFDILSILMMQFGAEMVSNNNSVTFDQEVEDGAQKYPAQEALNFYAKFSQAEWETYNWNEDIFDAVDAFVNNKLAYYLGYHRSLEGIQQLNPNLNFDIATLPQINPSSEVNYASYWAESVSVNSANKEMAWAFIQYLTNEENSKKYLQTTQKPAARRSLINSQFNEYELAVFAKQALTSKNWYHGKDPKEAGSVFAEMITKINSGGFETKDIVSDAARKMQLTYK